MPRFKLTPEEYLAIERTSPTKHEFLDGEVFEKAGASEPHGVIVVNLAASLHEQFRGRPCRTYVNDMRIKVTETGLYTYPDVAAICGEPALEDGHRDTLLNPFVIFEVLSPSTEAYDRGKKFAHYRRVASLTDYVLVSQDIMRVEHYTRQSGGLWTFVEHGRADDVLQLKSIDCRIRIAEVYDKVDFSATSVQ